MNFEALHAITKTTNLTTYEKGVLWVICMNSKRENYDKELDVIKNITISNVTLMAMINCSKSMIYKTMSSLRQKGILINLKENENGYNNHVMIIARIKELVPVLNNNKDEEKVIHRRPQSGMERPYSGQEGPQSGMERPYSGPNNIINNTINNNNYKRSYFLKNDFKIHNLEHTQNLLSAKLDLMLVNKELPLKYKKDDLIVECMFHLKNYSSYELTKQFNICIDLIKKETWDVPTKLKIQRTEEAEAREREAQLEKKRQCDDIRNNGILDIVFGAKSSKQTALDAIQQIMKQLPKGQNYGQDANREARTGAFG